MTYKPDYRWLIDWDGDGSYSNPHSDVTDFLRQWSIVYGGTYEADASRVVFRPASGSLIFSENGAIYDPTNTSFVESLTLTDPGDSYSSAPEVAIRGDGSGATATAEISGGEVTSLTLDNGGSGYTWAEVDIEGGAEATATIGPGPILRASYLRRRNQCRLVIDGDVEWEGTAIHKGRSVANGVVQVSFELDSKHANKHQEDTAINHDARTTVRDFVSRVTSETGVPIAIDSDQPIGVVAFDGRFPSLMNTLADYACGYFIETSTGDVVYRNYADAEMISVGAGLGLEYEPSADNFFYGDQPGHVRNKLVVTGSFWDTDLDNVQGLAETTLEIPSGESRVVTFDFDERSSTRPARAVAYVVQRAVRGGDTVTPTPALSYEEASTTNYSITTEVTAEDYGGDPIDFTIQVRGNIARLVSTDEREITIEAYESQSVYGERETRFPPWFTSDFAGLYEYTLPFMYHLAAAPRYVRIQYTPWQDTQGRSRVITHFMKPGLRAQSVVNDPVLGLKTIDYMVLSTRITGGLNIRPTHTFTGYEIFQPEIPEAHIELRGVSYEVAVVEVGIISGVTDGDIHLRYRASGETAWETVDALTLENRTAEFGLEGLTSGAEYEVQVARNDMFTEVIAETSFETLMEIPDSLRLATVTVEGTEITAFDEQETVANYDYTTYLSEPTVTVQATAMDEDSTVTLSPDTAIPVVDRGSYHWRIIVINVDGDQQAYDLYVHTTTTHLLDFNTLSAAGNTNPRAITLDQTANRVWVHNRTRHNVHVIHAYVLDTGEHMANEKLTLNTTLSSAAVFQDAQGLCAISPQVTLFAAPTVGWYLFDRFSGLWIGGTPPLYPPVIAGPPVDGITRAAPSGCDYIDGSYYGLIAFNFSSLTARTGDDIEVVRVPVNAVGTFGTPSKASFTNETLGIVGGRCTGWAMESPTSAWTCRLNDNRMRKLKLENDLWVYDDARPENSISLTDENSHPTNIALVDRRLLVVDSIDDKIYVYDTESGEYVGGGS